MTGATDRPILVKLLMGGSRDYPSERWARQFPRGETVWGRCRFVFDPDLRRYDWLVAYDDLPPDRGAAFKKGREELACPPAHTLLLTSEPSSIKLYGRRFVAQFGCVLTSQEEWALPHRDAIRAQPALHWFYGMGRSRLKSFDDMLDNPPVAKSQLISTICSSKRQRHTLHNRRYLFTQELKSLVPALDVFGHGVRDMDDKAEALDAHKYHVAVENHRRPHHWTEKLADPFLGCCLPFYFGAPNASDYFPADSFIPIDIFDPEGAAKIIRRAIENSEYEKRLPFILEARRRVLYEYNTFAFLSRLIEARHSSVDPTPGVMLLNRHAMRYSSPIHCLEDTAEKVWRRLFRPKERQ